MQALAVGRAILAKLEGRLLCAVEEGPAQGMGVCLQCGSAADQGCKRKRLTSRTGAQAVRAGCSYHSAPWRQRSMKCTRERCALSAACPPHARSQQLMPAHPLVFLCLAARFVRVIRPQCCPPQPQAALQVACFVIQEHNLQRDACGLCVAVAWRACRCPPARAQ